MRIGAPTLTIHESTLKFTRCADRAQLAGSISNDVACKICKWHLSQLSVDDAWTKESDFDTAQHHFSEVPSCQFGLEPDRCHSARLPRLVHRLNPLPSLAWSDSGVAMHRQTG